MSTTFRAALDGLDEASFQTLYGPIDPMPPAEIAALLAGCGARPVIVGGRAARVGAPTRHHEDTDVAIRLSDLGAVRRVMRDWHLWEVADGALRPLLPGVAVSPDCGQLWVRRDARQPWRFEFLLDRLSTDEEWVYKRDARVRLPWARAVHAVDGVEYLRPEVALLIKARNDRPKDRADLLAARLEPAGRDWLADTLDQLGQAEWATLARSGRLPAPAGSGTGRDTGSADSGPGATGAIEQD